MALTVDNLRDRKEQKMTLVKPGKRLWLTADRSRLVGDGDAAAAILFCAADDEVDAATYGRLVGSTETKAEAKAEDKAVAKPADKARRKPEDK